MSAEKPERRGPTARSIAAEVLVRVEKDGAFASAVLEAEIARAVQLDGKDRALATELSYGALRVLPWLRARIDAHAKRGTKSLDPRVFAELALGAYELFFAEKIPAFATVSEHVETVRRSKGKEVAAFVNAVLRRLSEEAKTAGDVRREATLASTPGWLREALVRALGEAQADSFLTSALEAPPVGIRVERAEERDAWLTRLREASPRGSFEPGRASPNAILARGAGKPQALPGYAEGAWSVQEEGSQVVALAVGARAGETILDACAGRGNKTAMLARAVGASGAVDAADTHAKKLDRLREELARIGLAPRTTDSVDWTVGPGDFAGGYDRALVDAPCSGTGTLRRRPELSLRRTPDDLAGLADLQTRIALRVSDQVKPGGRLFFAVCSVLREEAEDVVARLLSDGRLALTPFDSDVARAIAGDAATLRLTPEGTGTDGYFVASFVKR